MNLPGPLLITTDADYKSVVFGLAEVPCIDFAFSVKIRHRIRSLETLSDKYGGFQRQCIAK
jgi:hypothetical protein